MWVAHEFHAIFLHYVDLYYSPGGLMSYFKNVLLACIFNTAESACLVVVHSSEIVFDLQNPCSDFEQDTSCALHFESMTQISYLRFVLAFILYFVLIFFTQSLNLNYNFYIWNSFFKSASFVTLNYRVFPCLVPTEY